MILFSIDHGIKRAFDSSSYKDIVEEFERVEKNEGVLYDAENKRLKKENDAYYLEYGEIEND